MVSQPSVPSLRAASPAIARIVRLLYGHTGYPLCPPCWGWLLCLCWLLLLCAPLRAEELDDLPGGSGHVVWQGLDTGLESAEIETGPGWPLYAVRISPQHYDFVLCASSQHGTPRSLVRWSEDFELVAAINAGMYLPDARTSVGYMRQGAHINQKRLARRPGAFFVAGPDRPDLPAAAILDRDDPRWQLLEHFELVIQNYRMIDAAGSILWQQGGPIHAIAAVAEDRQGRILFLYAPGPLDPYEFSRELLELPLEVRTAMYVEGGSQAGLVLRTGPRPPQPAQPPDTADTVKPAAPTGLRVLGGQGRALLPMLAAQAALPNVLGVRRKGSNAPPAQHEKQANPANQAGQGE